MLETACSLSDKALAKFCKELFHRQRTAAQGRTQDRADGAKAPPPRNPPKKIIYSFKSGAFYVSQFVHPVADYVSPDSID